MQFDVIIPTRGGEQNLKTILDCIAKQSFLPYRVILVVNGFVGTNEECKIVIDQIMPEEIKNIVTMLFVDKELSGNASYARNIGREHATSPYVYFLDDDNQFSPHFFASCIAEYTILRGVLGKDLLYSPTILWRNTSIIQSQGIKAFHYLVGRPEPVVFAGWKNAIIKMLRFMSPLPVFYYHNNQNTRAAMIGGNSLLSLKTIFDANPFDEDMAFVYEDVDTTCRITLQDIPLIVSHKAQINHMERNKTKLEQSFLGNIESAYKKSKNRIIFVKKNALFKQKLVFFIFGLPLTSLMSFGFIIMAGGKNRWSLSLAYRKGIVSGIQHKI